MKKDLNIHIRAKNPIDVTPAKEAVSQFRNISVDPASGA
jgi:hypothetical protein